MKRVRLDAQNCATIKVLLEDACKRFDRSPRMLMRIQRALIAIQLLECEQLIDSLNDDNPTPACLRRQAE